MPELLPFLQLRDPESGSCFQPFNNCSTLARLRQEPGWSTGSDLDCDECCPCEDVTDYTGDPFQDGLWWGDIDDPSIDDFLGFVVDSMDLEPTASVRRRGESTTVPVPFSPRLLEINARILSRSRAGTYIAESILLPRFLDECGSCDGWEATVRPFCSDVEEPQFNPSLWVPDMLPPLLEDDAACGPCQRQDPDWEPQRLGPDVDDNTPIDSGIRTVMRVKFVSMDLAETEEPMEYCFGREIRIVFEVFDDYEWGEGIEGLCTLDRGFDTFRDAERCRPVDWSHCFNITEPSTRCTEDPDLVDDDPRESARPALPFGGRFCSPLLRSVRACLLPSLPSSAEVGLGFEINSGSEDLRSLEIKIWPAFPGIPSPETCEGEKFYRTRQPCGRLQVPYMPSESQIVVDGRSQRTTLSCLGASPVRAESSIEAWDYSLLDPSCRYWVTVTTDCLRSAPDVSVRTVLYPRFQT